MKPHSLLSFVFGCVFENNFFPCYFRHAQPVEHSKWAHPFLHIAPQKKSWRKALKNAQSEKRSLWKAKLSTEKFIMKSWNTQWRIENCSVQEREAQEKKLKCILWNEWQKQKATTMTSECELESCSVVVLSGAVRVEWRVDGESAEKKVKWEIQCSSYPYTIRRRFSI